MAFIVTIFKEDNSENALDAFSGEHDEVIDSMADENYPNDLLDKIDATTQALWAETNGVQKTVWHYPYSVEIRKV